MPDKNSKPATTEKELKKVAKEVVPVAPEAAVPRRGKFGDYKDDAHNWITLATGEFYPDILSDACNLYGPVLVRFGQILRASETSSRIFQQINEVPNTWMRVQLCRIFRKYVSPGTPVEMLKRKTKGHEVIEQFSDKFRKVNEVQAAFDSRPLPDEAICAILWEYKDRGKKGYDLTERMFDLFTALFPDLKAHGPRGAGRDIMMGDIFPDYPNPKRPTDFIITEGKIIRAVGFARYDGDRGGAQEDDRTGGYRNASDEFMQYAAEKNLGTKVIFVNDGPGLLLGSMWDDYTAIEDRWENTMVVTLRMISDRLTQEWLES